MDNKKFDRNVLKRIQLLIQKIVRIFKRNTIKTRSTFHRFVGVRFSLTAIKTCKEVLTL